MAKTSFDFGRIAAFSSFVFVHEYNGTPNDKE